LPDGECGLGDAVHWAAENGHTTLVLAVLNSEGGSAILAEGVFSQWDVGFIL